MKKAKVRFAYHLTSSSTTEGLSFVDNCAPKKLSLEKDGAFSKSIFSFHMYWKSSNNKCTIFYKTVQNLVLKYATLKSAKENFHFFKEVEHTLDFH